MPIAEAAEQLGTRTFVAMRADIQLGLYDGLEPGVVQLGSKVTGFTDSDQNVTVHVEGRPDEPGAALLGADGVRSAVRAQLRGDQPRYTGYMAWRGVAELDPPPLQPGVANQLLGRGRTCGAIGLTKGRMY